jgi:hypothetical protein
MLQAKEPVTRALVHNRLTVDQGTSANEALHRNLGKVIRNFGGNRNYKSLYLMLNAALYVYNGVNFFYWCGP